MSCVAALWAVLWLAGCAATSALPVAGKTVAAKPVAAKTAAERSIAGQEATTIDQAAALASACSGCHRTGGRAITDLQAYSALQIEQSLRAYKQAADGPTAMHRMARGYSDAELAAIARRLGR